MGGSVVTLLGWLDPMALCIVLGGSVLVAAIRARKGEVRAAFAALGPCLRADPSADAEAAMRTVRSVEAIAGAKSLVCVDRVATTGRFLREALWRLSDTRDSLAYARWAEATLADRKHRHAGVASFWNALADAAPAMGMIATVIGLVRMFAHLDDPKLIGPPMASALIATLLGLILANVIAGPIAARLERLSEDERAWQAEALEHFVALARAELDGPASLQSRLRQRFGA